MLIHFEYEGPQKNYDRLAEDLLNEVMANKDRVYKNDESGKFPGMTLADGHRLRRRGWPSHDYLSSFLNSM
jgi:hypothetical protein